MFQTLPKYFPILDHLYIYQILEYDFGDFFKWFLKNPSKRFLQKKHKLVFSNKILALLFLTVFWQVVAALIFYSLTKSIIVFILAYLLIQPLTPVFIIMADLSLDPIENYLKNKLLKKALEKLTKLPKLKVVAITGSFGKTSTKDILYTLLFKKYYVVKTPKNFNTPLGIAETVLEQVKENTQIFICEMGAYKMGEIAKISQLVKPKIGIITAVAPQHLERFGSLENIAKAKFELVESLPKNGLAILNGEYEIIRNLSLHPGGVRTIFYGPQNDPFFATSISSGVSGTSFTLHTPKGKAEINIPLIGEHHVQNFLAATAVALNLGLTLAEVKERAKLLLPTPHRLEIKKQGSLTIIDNTYNTNPKASRASLKLLSEIPGRQKIIITPGLVELGGQAAKENEALAKDAAKVVDEFIIVGENAKADLLRGLSNFPADKLHLVSSTQEGIGLLSKIAKTGAVVLLENDLPDQYS